MNNRGKQLSNLEILKNRLIYLTTIFSDEDLNATQKNLLWTEINNAWKEIYKQIGRNPNNPLNDDEFLKSHWTMFFTYSRNKGDDYINDLLNKRFNQKAVFGDKITNSDVVLICIDRIASQCTKLKGRCIKRCEGGEFAFA